VGKIRPRQVTRRPPAPPHQAPAPVRVSRPELWIYLALFLATFVVYAQARHFAFVNFDDPEYVAGNPHVRGGITADSLRWALTSVEAANWFPVTRLSHLLDVQLFGLRSGWHHLTNVLFHALAAMLLFAFLHRATRALWPAALVAGLFALHPLHVESVAWIAERKDVLSAFFWFLTLWAYVRYTERPARGRYALVLVAFCLGLMAKPMIVTLPFVLLLVDVWPLRRVPLLREKMPFFALSAASAVATYLVQRGSGAVETLSGFPLALRAENALVSYVVYIVKMFWPSRLAVFYPYPAAVPLWEAALAALTMLAISALVVRWFRVFPYLAVGWFWYVGTLVPVIGMVQVGAQARADRYTYVPMVGLAIMLAWGGADALVRWPRARPAIAAAAAALGLAWGTLTWVQTEYWQNSLALFRHALDVTEGNYLAHHNLGNALSEIPGHLPEAISQYEESLRIKPDSARVHTDLGNALARLPGRLPDAIAEYQAALRITPDSPIPHNDLGNTLAKIPGRLPEAIAEYQSALRLAPDYAEAHNNLGSALAKTGRLPEAIAEMETALRLAPDDADAHTNLGRALAAVPGRAAEAVAHYQTALRLSPDSAEAHNDLGTALTEMPGRLPEAIAEYETALRLKPDYAAAHVNLGSTLAEIPNRLPEAISEYQAALRIQPDSAEAHYNLGAALSKTGAHGDAIAQFEAALRIRPDYAEAHNNLGVMLSSMPGRLPEAISHFEAALRIRPDYVDAHYNLGVALADIPGRLPQAISHFEAAQRIKPDRELQNLLNRLHARLP
jgi:tetratricopeptide (TPR) repeat protein